MTWQPQLASMELEEAMERKGAPESDRDEVRRFAEFLNAKKPAGLTPAMKTWARGEDTQGE
jgi:hypothetical protein